MAGVTYILAILLSFGAFVAFEAVDAFTDLVFYDAGNSKDMADLWRWDKILYKTGRNITSESIALKHLKDESCKNQSSDRCKYFKEASAAGKTVPSLWSAECIAVTMYTGGFYKEYNNACFNSVWDEYKVYSYLLRSALRKLSQIRKYKVDAKATLYRGLWGQFNKPNVDKLYWKTFTSASLKIDVAHTYSGPEGTTFVIKPVATRSGAQVTDLSLTPNQSDVLISPFESFDFLPESDAAQRTFYFKSSDIQEFYLGYHRQL